MAEEQDSSVSHLNIAKLCLSADYYANLCPAVSRFCMSKVRQLKKSEGVISTPAHVCCQFCDSVYRPGNYKVKVLPKMVSSSKIKKLEYKVSIEGEQSLGKFQRQLYSNFKNSRTRVQITCYCCKKKTVIPCPRKPEKILPVAVNSTESKAKQSRKKLKQKRRRARLHNKDSAATFSTSTVIKPKETKSSGAGIVSKSSATTGQGRSCSNFQRTLPSKSRMQSSKGKKSKSKDVHSTLHRMLQKEKQEVTASKNSLQKFLSSL